MYSSHEQIYIYLEKFKKYGFLNILFKQKNILIY